MSFWSGWDPVPELKGATQDLFAGRFESFFGRTAKYPFGMHPWQNYFDELLAFPIPEANSPTYTWDSPQNLPAYDHPVPVAYGCADTGGLLLYQGGDGELRDVFVAVSEGTVRRIDAVKVNGVAWELLKGSSGEGARVATHLGTGAQTVDKRFTLWRHQEVYGGTAWNLKTSDTTAAVGTFEVLENGAYVLVKLGVLYALNEQEWKYVDAKVEWKLQAAGLWTDGGTFRLTLDQDQGGLEECRVPLFTAGDTDQTPVPFTYGYTEGTRACNLGKRAEQAAYRVVKDATVHVFDAGLYDLRVTYVTRANGGAEREIDGQLVLASAEVVETAGGQAYRHTAYVAATIPASDLAQGSATITSRVAGRDTVEVWDGSAWQTRWTNNPVWIARDLWRNARYGAGQTAFDDARAKLAAAYCDAAIATLATATVSAGGGTTALTVTGLAYESGDDVPVDLSGYLVVSQAAETRLCVYHDQTGGVLHLDRAFDVAATSVTVKEQRFRFDYVFDAEADVEEQARRIAAHCRGVVWREGGTLSFDIERARDPSAFQAGVTTITPDLILEGSFSAERRSERDVPSGIALKFLDPDQAHPKQSEIVGDASGKVEEAELYGCRNPRQARRVGAYLYNAARAVWVCRLRTSLATVALEPGDVVQVAHPVTGWGYTMTDVDAPVRNAATDKAFVIVSVADGEDDTRDYTLREYDAALYSDTADRLTVRKAPSAFVNPFAPPAAFSALRGSNLGDLTNDGVYNPVVEVGWTHPQPDGVGQVELYGSRDGGTSWRLLGRFGGQEGSGRVTIADWSGTLKVLALPISQAGVPGVWADQPTADVAVAGQLDYVSRTTADVTWHVATATGSDTTGDGSSGAPWQTIAKAVAAVPRRIDHAVRVQLATGTYRESVRIEERVGGGSLALAPETAASPVILPPTNPGSWAATTAYAYDRHVVEYSNGIYYAYRAVVGGTSGGSEPTWPTTVGATVTDGTVTWQCIGESSVLLELPAVYLKRLGCRVLVEGLELVSDEANGGHLVEARHCERLHLKNLAGGYEGTFDLGAQCFVYGEDSTITVEGLTNAAGRDPIEYGYDLYRCTVHGYHPVGHYQITDPRDNVLATSQGEVLAASDVRVHGAAGGADDTEAFQKALDWAALNGGEVWIPPGTWTIKPASGVTTTRSIGVSDGLLLPGWTYEVIGTAGVVTYDGTAYAVGETFEGVFGVTGWAGAAVTGATQANPCVVTIPGHRLQTDDPVRFTHLVGMTELNTGTFTATRLTDDTISIGVDSSGYGAYTSGGWAYGDAEPAFQVAVALYASGQKTRIRGAGKSSILRIEGAGVGLGLLEVPAPALGERTIVWYADLDAFVLKGDGTSSPQMGLMAEYCCYYGRSGNVYLWDLAVGAYLHECWNWHTERLELEGGGRMDAGAVLENANQMVIGNLYTHQMRQGLRVTTYTAHGGSVGQPATVCEETSIGQYSGPIVKVVSATEFLLYPAVKSATTTLAAGDCLVDGTTTTMNARLCELVGGVGVLATSAEGLWIHGGQVGHRGSTGIELVVAGTAGSQNVGPVVVKGEFEGPATGVKVRRAPYATSGELRGLDVQITCWAGRDGSDTHFGRRHGVVLDYVRAAKIHEAALSTRSLTATVNVTGAYQENPCRLTLASDAVQTGDEVYLTLGTPASFTGMYELNGRWFTATRTGSAEITLDGEDATAHSAWVSGGTVKRAKSRNHCVWIKDTCHDVTIENATYDHNEQNDKVRDDQVRPLAGTSSAFVFQNVDGPTLASWSGLTSSISPRHVQVSRGVRTFSAGDDSEARWPRFVRLRWIFALNAMPLNGALFAAAIDRGGRFPNWTYTPNLSAAGLSRVTSGSALTITGATQANPCQVTVSGTAPATGSVVWIAGVGGMTQLNGALYTVTNTGASTLTLDGVNATGYGAYTSGGTALVQVAPTIRHEMLCPVSADGFVTVQVFAPPASGWDVDVTLQQTGSEY